MLSLLFTIIQSIGSIKYSPKRKQYNTRNQPNSNVLTSQEGRVYIPSSKLLFDNQDNWKLSQGDSNILSGHKTTTAQSSANYTFYGTQVDLVVYPKSESTQFSVTLDGTINNLDISAQSTHVVVFSSDELDFQSHTIQIENTQEGQELIICGLYINPISKNKGSILGFKQFEDKYGEWTTTDGMPPTFSSNSEDVHGTFNFYGSRFWLTGLCNPNEGEFELDIDYSTHLTIRERCNDRFDLPYLLYQSDELQLGFHTVMIHKTEYQISLKNLFVSYNDHEDNRVVPTPIPSPNAVPIPHPVKYETTNKLIGTIRSNISVETDWECTQHRPCPNGYSSFECGYQCQVTPTSYSIYFEYTFTGERFRLFGGRGRDLKSYNLFLDGKQIATINQTGYKSINYFIQYTSELLPYGEHIVRIESDEVFSFHKFAHWPNIKAKRLNVSDFNNPLSSIESDGAGGRKMYGTGNPNISLECYKFWVYGGKGDWFGSLGISYNGISYSKTQYADIRDYSQTVIKYQTVASLLIESPNLLYTNPTESEFKITSTSMFSYVYYLDDLKAIPVSIPVLLLNSSPDDARTTVTTNVSCPVGDNPAPTPCPYLCGSESQPKTDGTKVSFYYTFLGECFQIFGQKGPDLQSYDIFLDNEKMATIDQNSETEEHYVLQYTSPVLIYGEHTIKAESDLPFSIFKFAYWPSLKARRVNITEFTKEIGGRRWKQEHDQYGGVQQYSDGSSNYNATLNISLHKFWCYGSTVGYHSNGIPLIYGDYSISLTVNVHHTFPEQYPYQLLAESPYLYNYQHTDLFVIKPTTTTMFQYFYYLSGIWSDPVSIPINQMETKGDYSLDNETLCPTSQPGNPSDTCGAIATANGNGLVSFQYQFKGNYFQIFGAIGNDLETYDIYLDDKLITTINQRSLTSQSRYTLH